MLSRQVVNDHLIQAICLLIPVDDYLGYVDYSRAHLDGLSTVVRLRGGHNKVGQSVKGMGPNLQTSLLVVKSLLISHMQTSLNPEHLPLNILPPAFHILIRANAITTPAIEILLSFSTWLTTHRQKQAHLIPVWRHQSTTPLTAIEKCLFAALLCLADDLSGMGVHPAAIIFRQPKKRAEMLLSVREFWTDPMLSDLVIWLSMVVTAPRNAGITPWGVQRELFRRIILGRPDLRGWADVRGVLQGFFFEEGRAGVWQVVWGEMTPIFLHQEIERSLSSSATIGASPGNRRP
ncbi:hypothetical protein BJY04DRAFT_232657 [Aspergillus karnatakaensis]|uniref:uncharacterized protein n=1 Tax=Aspergillus karnatakaensis TaxID=1810916 RepID=UPI003CCCC813